jgi:hypothetical protein
MQGGAMGGAMGGAAGGEAGKPNRSSWKSLSTRTDAAGEAGGGAMMGGSLGGSPQGSKLPGREDPLATKEKEKEKGGQQRTEFVILFIWQEPTPSDALRGFADSAAPNTGGTPKK